MNRNITGTIRKTDGAVWAGATVEFELERSSYDDSAQYPMHVVRAVSDENGEIALTLWINEEALRPSRYICTMPDGCQFRFTLPEGVGDADLAVLRESAIEEDSPTQSTLVAFLPVVRAEAQQLVDQAVAGLDTAIDAKADQTALDETNTTVDQLIDGVEILSGRVDTKAEQSALNLTNSDLAALHIEVEDKASQTALDSVNVNLAALDAEVDTKASQSALSATNANVATLTTGLTTGLAAANTAIATKANQSSLDTTNTNLTALDAEVDTKAAQSEVNNLWLELDTKAKQVSLDDTNANVLQLTDDLFSVNAGMLSLTNGLTDANSAIATKANQSSLNTTNANVTTVTNGLAAANTAIATKAAQSALDTTNANVTTLTDGLATANAEIAIRARQTALNTTNSNVTALSGVVDTKASELALNAAISNLEDAISAAQTTLETLIDQKADLAHIHESSDIHNDVDNAVGYFNSSGDLAGSDQFVFTGEMLGLGTADPEYTVDLRHPNAILGDQARMTVLLNGPGPIVHLSSDPLSTQPPAINFECGGLVNTIDSDVNGIMSFGQEGVATGFAFRTVDGSYTFLGLKFGSGEPDDTIFPPLTFGFYKMLSHGGWLVDSFYLVFHDGDVVHALSFSKG
jgi:hypothetical protein